MSKSIDCFSIVVEVDVLSGRLDDYLRLLDEMMDRTQHETNLISFEVHATLSDPTHLTLIENWHG